MRFSQATLALGLPALAVAEGNDYVAQFQGQFQKFVGQAQGYFNKLNEQVPAAAPEVPSDPVEAVEAKVGELTVHSLTLDNWNETLFSPVQAESTEPETWWILITGGNKTCHGFCEKYETAFNASAAKFGVLPGGPHVGMLNCENEPVLCNAWSAPAGYLYIFDMLPAPSPVEVYTKRLNHTTVDTEEIDQLYQQGHKSFGRLHDGYFHPYSGPLADNGLLIPAGYLIYYFNLVPSWAVMLLISLFSRTFMANRATAPRPRAEGQAVPAPAPAQ